MSNWAVVSTLSQGGVAISDVQCPGIIVKVSSRYFPSHLRLRFHHNISLFPSPISIFPFTNLCDVKCEKDTLVLAQIWTRLLLLLFIIMWVLWNCHHHFANNTHVNIPSSAGGCPLHYGLLQSSLQNGCPWTRVWTHNLEYKRWQNIQKVTFLALHHTPTRYKRHPALNRITAEIEKRGPFKLDPITASVR